MLSTAHPYSKLRFAVSSESPEMTRLTRVRKAVSRSKAGVQGKVADILTGRSLHAESLNELAGFRVIIVCSRADVCQEQPCVLEYYHAGKIRHYTPDALLVWGGHRELVEIKDDAEAELPENRERFALIQEHLSEHGFQFRVWCKSEIVKEPRFSNVAVVLRYRTTCPSAQDRERIRRAVASPADFTLASLMERTGASLPTVLRLVLEGTLYIDWWEPITRNVRVSGIPLGRLEWPCPPAASGASPEIHNSSLRQTITRSVIGRNTV